MFKVLCPVERRDGTGQWWMRCGTAYENKDDSINIFMEALPLVGNKSGEGVKLQLREYTAEEMRERAEKKASYQARTPAGYDPNGLPSSAPYPRTGDTANDRPPF
jgi:hypothetical protein